MVTLHKSPFIMKKLLFLVFLAALSLPLTANAQKKGKLSTDEAAKKTPDQRYVYETERKEKKKKKKLSTKQKVRVQEKQEKAVRKKKPTKHH